MEETFKAYVAGLFDGDGSVFIRRQKYGDDGRHSYIVQVGFAMQSKETLDILAKSFGGKVYMSTKGGHRAHDWKVSRADACEFLKIIQPYVITKKQQVMFALFAYDNFLSLRKPGQHHMADEEVVIKELVCNIMSLLNHKDSMTFYGKSGEFDEQLKTLFTNLVSKSTSSQAAAGIGSAEGVTTREVSPNNNLPQERPTLQ